MNALQSAETARAKGGLAMFLCPHRAGDLLLTPATCAGSHKMAQVAQEDAKVRLWECRTCEVGAANLAALGAPVPRKRDRSHSMGMPETLVATLEFVRDRGRCTSLDAAKHFGRHRDTIAERFHTLEGLGLVRRLAGASRTLVWEAA